MNTHASELYAITEAAHACGLSRSTLLRLEARGLLTPAYTSPDSGRRYYDNYNIARVLQIEALRAMGLSAQDIAAYFASGGDASEQLRVMEARLREFERSVEELRIRAAQNEPIRVQIVTLPAVTCCTRRVTDVAEEDAMAAMYDFYGVCVRRGCVIAREPLFRVMERTDYLAGHLSADCQSFTLCIPVQPDKAPKDAVLFPDCAALSVLYYGGAQEQAEAWLTLGREAIDRGVKIAGHPRAVDIVSSYTGAEIKQKRYCSRLALPIEE